ncbi:MAG: DNA topoisomerase VI subunit B [Planctomycetota bacterium]|jgi:DNA topoisomerase-6 subunit B
MPLHPPGAVGRSLVAPVGRGPQQRPARGQSAPSGGSQPKRVTAETLARQQREISVSEFFAKNRHLLGFDNKRKSLLTTVKEAVDNSLDACEEAGILPDLSVEVSQRAEDRFRVVVHDNGPGVVKGQIPNIFGKLLYGSKFHRLKMARGQQGIGISAAGMYGLVTTGTPVSIISRTGTNKPAHHFKIAIDTKKNRPEIAHDDEVEVDWPHGTRVEINLVASYAKGRQSIDEYLDQTAIVNPHARIRYTPPLGEPVEYARTVEHLPAQPKEIKPHPHGIELGILMKMMFPGSALRWPRRSAPTQD